MTALIEPALRLTCVSLFAGVGGIDLALQRAGVRVVACVEKDHAARGVLADRFPGMPLFNDVREVNGDQLRAAGFVPERGLLAAGWPCQGNSTAGPRTGMDDPRSGLWVHIARLLAELCPAWFLGENVPGLLSVNGGWDFATVIRDVADSGMGCAWRVLDAQHFGVPQRRRRVFVVGCAGSRTAPVEVLFEPESSRRDPAPSSHPRPDADAVAALGASSGSADDNDAQGGQLIVSTLLAGSARSYRTGADEAAAGHLIVGTLQTRRSGGGTPLVSQYDYGVLQQAAVRRLSPLECERLQGFPDGWTATSNGSLQADAPRYRQLGNAVAVPVAEWIARRIAFADRVTRCIRGAS